MPILRVAIVGNPEDYATDLAQRIADLAGEALESRKQGTWVKLEFLSLHRYAENGGMASGDQPVIVSVIQADLPAGDALRKQVTDLSNAMAEATGHPLVNVHLVMEPSARGRIAFGGHLVE